MRIKVRGGTAEMGSPSLCYSCRYATVVRGDSLRDEVIDCDQLSGTGRQSRVHFRVTDCNKYRSASAPSLNDMRDMAWVLRTDEKRRIGFVPYKDLNKDEKAKFEMPYNREDDD